MDQINAVELRDPSVCPDAPVLKRILGDSYGAYEALLKLYADMGVECTWRYYHDGKAWLCKVQKKKKTIVWMSAWRGYMQATIYIHEKYAEALKGIEVREETQQRNFSVKKVGKSIPCTFEIRGLDVLEDVEKMLRFKIELV